MFSPCRNGKKQRVRNEWERRFPLFLPGSVRATGRSSPRTPVRLNFHILPITNRSQDFQGKIGEKILFGTDLPAIKTTCLFIGQLKRPFDGPRSSRDGSPWWRSSFLKTGLQNTGAGPAGSIRRPPSRQTGLGSHERDSGSTADMR